MANQLKQEQLLIYNNNKKKNNKKKKENIEKKVSQFLRLREKSKIKDMFGNVGPGKIDTGIRKWK